MTNAEKIKSLSIDEMKKYIKCPNEICIGKVMHCPLHDGHLPTVLDCRQCKINWLNQEAE